MAKSFEEIQEKIRKKTATIVTAQEMVKIVEKQGAKKASQTVDVVTTGTFGCMCSSGAFFNFGHSDPPIKIEQLWLNGVEAYHGNAAVDCYLGVTKMDPARPFEYGGGHVLEDLVAGKTVHLEAEAYGTDCYPGKKLSLDFKLEDLNQAILLNPRNAYQTYVAATNSTDKTIKTYMGVLLPKHGNVTYAGAGELSPLNNDPEYETIGLGTRIFLGGAQGYILGQGTQHSPKNSFGTIATQGNLKEMNTEYLRGAALTGYGTSLALGIGIPIPILNERIAKNTGRGDHDIKINLVDYGVPKRNRPTLKQVSYEELRTGKTTIKGKQVKTSSMTSIKKSKKIAETLKDWIQRNEFQITKPIERLPTDTVFKPMKQAEVSR